MVSDERLIEDGQRLLEVLIGAGLGEYGLDPNTDPRVMAVCRKLGLNPIDWHGNRMLK